MSHMGQTVYFLISFVERKTLVLFLTRYDKFWNLTPCTGGHFDFYANYTYFCRLNFLGTFSEQTRKSMVSNTFTSQYYFVIYLSIFLAFNLPCMCHDQKWSHNDNQMWYLFKQLTLKTIYWYDNCSTHKWIDLCLIYSILLFYYGKFGWHFFGTWS